jgi:hypothetical protein
MVGFVARTISGIIVGAILGALVGVIVGCRFASRSELGYGQAIIVAWAFIAGWLGAGIGLLVIVFRSMDGDQGGGQEKGKEGAGTKEGKKVD